MTREEIARVIAEELYDDFDNAFASKTEWAQARGEKGGRFRDINEPMQGDYLDAADAVLTKLHQDAGNGELVARLRAIKGPHNVVRACFEAADALERGSQVVEMLSLIHI